jgi:hypothetical protein
MSVSKSESTLIGSEQNRLLAEMLERKYGSWLDKRYFEVDGHLDGPSLYLKITLKTADRSYVYPIEGRMNFADQDMKVDEARDFLLDFMDAYVQEYLSGGEETFLTIDWSTYDCDGIELQLRGQIFNENLEALADQWIEGSASLQ